MNVLTEAADGGFTSVRSDNDGALIIRYDQDFNPVWSKRLNANTNAVNSWPRVAAAPVSGILVVSPGGLAYDVAPPTDSVDLLINAIRITHAGQVFWAKAARLRFDHWSNANPVLEQVVMNDSGAVVLAFRSNSNIHGPLLLRLHPDGQASWLAELPEDYEVPFVEVPNGSSGCVYWTNEGTDRAVGRINPGGTSGWHRQFSGSPYGSAGRVVSTADGGVFAATIGSGNNAVLMRLGPAGELEWVRLNATVPPVPAGIAPGILGLAALDDGFVVATAGSNPARAILRYHSADGLVTQGRRTTTLALTADVDRRLSITSLSRFNDAITLGGSVSDHNTVFNLYSNHPLLSNVVDLSDLPCHFANETTSEMEVPVSSIVTDLLPQVPLLSAFPTQDIAVEMEDETLPTTSLLCSSVGITEQREDRYVLFPNPVLAGGSLQLPDGSWGIAQVVDTKGSIVQHHESQLGAPRQLPIVVEPGAYVVQLTNFNTGQRISLPLIVE